MYLNNCFSPSVVLGFLVWDASIRVCRSISIRLSSDSGFRLGHRNTQNSFFLNHSVVDLCGANFLHGGSMLGSWKGWKTRGGTLNECVSVESFMGWDSIIPILQVKMELRCVSVMLCHVCQRYYCHIFGWKCNRKHFMFSYYKNCILLSLSSV